jgi:hypothetical protein
MFDFYLIASVIVNILLFLIWKKDDLHNFAIKVLLLALSITGTLVLINTYNLIN